jgi:hypothetical protein
MLRSFKQPEAIELLDLLLGVGLLRQQEVNRHRPTVSVSPELTNPQIRDELLSAVEIPLMLARKIRSLVSASPAGPATAQTANVQSPSSPRRVEPACGPQSTVVKQPESTHPASQGTPARTPSPGPSHPDWQWTLELLKAGYDWNVVRAMRRMSDDQLSADCCEAIRAGATIERSWLTPASGDLRTPGQQRVVRELQRRASAGV